MQLVWYL